MNNLRFKLNIQQFAEGGDGNQGNGDGQGEKEPSKVKDTDVQKSVEELTSQVKELTSTVKGLKDESEKTKASVDGLKEDYSKRFVSGEEEHAHDNKPKGLFEAIVNANKR